LKKVQDQGAQIPRNEKYLAYAAVTRDVAQRRYWAFLGSHQNCVTAYCMVCVSQYKKGALYENFKN